MSDLKNFNLEDMRKTQKLLIVPIITYYVLFIISLFIRIPSKFKSPFQLLLLICMILTIISAIKLINYFSTSIILKITSVVCMLLPFLNLAAAIFINTKIQKLVKNPPQIDTDVDLESGEKQCTSCHAPSPIENVICLSCGYNFQTGKNINETQTEKPIIAGVLCLLGGIISFIILLPAVVTTLKSIGMVQQFSAENSPNLPEAIGRLTGGAIMVIACFVIGYKLFGTGLAKIKS